MPSTTIELDAVLFDMVRACFLAILALALTSLHHFVQDGTLIDSTPAVNAVWRAFGAKWNVDAEDIISCAS